jgi:hypothetical protein
MSSTSRSPDESSPVEDGESLLRRFPSDPGQYDFTLAVPRFSAMIPTAVDTDGLSLYRELFISARQLLARATNQNVANYGGVLAVLAVWLREQGLTIRPDTEDHVVVPEMNRNDYSTREGKKRIQAWADKLVRLVAEHQMVRIPATQKPPAK